MSSRDSAAARGRHPVGAGAESLGQLVANVELDVGVAHGKRLRIGVASDEFDAAQSSVDHAVDGVGTAAADADDLDDCQITSAFHEISSGPLVRVEGLPTRGLRDQFGTLEPSDARSQRCARCNRRCRSPNPRR
jgi:hypothetical protein